MSKESNTIIDQKNNIFININLMVVQVTEGADPGAVTVASLTGAKIK